MKQIADLEQRQRELTETVAGRERRLAALGDPEAAYDEREVEWRSIHYERTNLLEEQCRRLSDLSKGLLRATVRRAAGAAHITTALKELVKGSKMRTERLDQLVDNVIGDPDPVSAWLEVVRELRALSEMDPPASAPIPSCPRIWLCPDLRWRSEETC